MHPIFFVKRKSGLRLFKYLFFAIAYGAIAIILLFVLGYIYYLESRPDLKIWHKTDLQAEFTAEKAKDIQNFGAYLDLEKRLFEELNEKVLTQFSDSNRLQLSRYNPGSPMDPESFPINWNRTFELIPKKPIGGVLLLHGLSDSPYSLRALGQLLYKRGYWVIGLRLPGHGTIPSGLLHVHWHDWAAAVRIAAHHLHSKIAADQPLFMLGYSNGAALAVEYAISVMEGEKIPAVNGLVLMSPAIGVTKVAAYASWQIFLGNMAGLEKMAWNSIQPEFDPYKYNSFTVNAGDQIYQLTSSIAERLQKFNGSQRVKGFPKVLVFQSIVDATVSPVIIIDALLSKLDVGGHEMVLFDINRRSETELLLGSDPEIMVQRLFDEDQLSFDLTFVTNDTPDSKKMVTRIERVGIEKIVEVALPQVWPQGVFSLSHVAIPFPPDDPIYGGTPYEGDEYPWITLGSISLRGERDLLLFPDSYFLRLRYNPFFSYLTQRVVNFLGGGHNVVADFSSATNMSED
jgi:esterase/lipase